jgi:hypothetical protein
MRHVQGPRLRPRSGCFLQADPIGYDDQITFQPDTIQGTQYLIVLQSEVSWPVSPAWSSLTPRIPSPSAGRGDYGDRTAVTVTE